MIIVGSKGFAKEVLEVIWQKEQNENIVFFDNISTDISDYLYDKFKIIRNFEDVSNYFTQNNELAWSAG